jgi:preprotein translocase subunit YajC
MGLLCNQNLRNFQQKDHYITVELIPGTEVKMQKNSVTAVLPKGTIKAI